MISVLYVDDEPDLLEIGKIFLEQGGRFSVDISTSAPAVLPILGKKEYDAIISDYQMPGMDGIEFLKQVRGSGNAIPFILFTGKGREEVVIQALNEGADFYLQKGGDPNAQFAELSHKIRQAVQQRQAEASIRDHERREADIINFLPDATFAIDTSGVVIAWNRAMEDFTGIVSSEILGKGNYAYALPLYNERRPILIDLVLKDDPVAEARYPYVIRSGKKLYSEIELPRKNHGESVLIWFTASPIYDTRGRIVGAIESIRDITERKKAEETLRESERRYRDVVEAQTEFVTRFRPDGTHVFVNEAYCRHFGKSREEIIGHRFIPPIPETDRERVRQHFASFTRDRPVSDIEHRVIMPDGSIRWHWWNDRAIYDADGTLVEFQSIGKDITDRKQAEERLRISERKFAAAFYVSPYPIAITDLKTGVLVDVNRAFEEWSGFSRSAITGNTTMNLNMWVHPEEREEIIRILGEGSGVHEREITLRRKNGEERSVLFSAQVFSTGETPYMLSLAEDISERKHAEAALRASESRFRTVIENIRDPVIILSFEGILLFANPAALELMGISSLAEAGTQSIGAYVDAGSLGQARRDLAVMKITGKPSNGEYIIKSRAGDLRCVEACGVRILYNGAEADLVTLRDITGRKQMEDELQQTVAEYQKILANISDVYYRSDREGNLILASNSWATLLGYPDVSECIGKNIATAFYLHPEERGRFLEAINRNGSVTDYEVVLKRKDGTPVTVATSSHLYHDREGNVRGVEGTFRDMTERKRFTEGLKEAEQRLMDIINFLPDATFAIDRAGKVIAWNRAIEEMTGVPAEDMIGKDNYAYALPFYGERRPILIDLVFKDDLDLIRNYSFVRRDGSVLTAETRMSHPGGKALVLWGKAGPLFNAQGEVVGAIESIRDITDWRRLEEVLKERESQAG